MGCYIVSHLSRAFSSGHVTGGNFYCNCVATNVALQLARKTSCATTHFCYLQCNATVNCELQGMENYPIATYDVASCKEDFMLQVARKTSCTTTHFCNLQCNNALRVARNGELSNWNLRCCKLQGRLHVASCKEDFMYNNPFLQSAMQQCIASCKERRTIQLEPTVLQVARETSCCKLQGRLHVQQPIFSTCNATMH